jgi:hypothetical protein
MNENSITTLCAHCRLPVGVDDAFPLLFEHADGTAGFAVFHRPPAQCMILWSLERLKTIGEGLSAALLNLKQAQEDAAKNSENLDDAVQKLKKSDDV